MEDLEIRIPVSTFKAVLLYSWDILPLEQQQFLRSNGVCPENRASLRPA